MSQHGLLKRPGSISGKKEQRISWGPENVHEFSRDLSPSSRNFPIDSYQQSPTNPSHLSSPAAPTPVTPIHYALVHSIAGLSPVSEEEHRSDFSQESLVDSQISINSIFPETEPFNIPSLNWVLPGSRMNGNRTPKKYNSQSQKMLMECKENLEKKKQEFKNLQNFIDEHEKKSKEMNNYLNEFNYRKREFLGKLDNFFENSENEFMLELQKNDFKSDLPSCTWKKIGFNGRYKFSTELPSDNRLPSLILVLKKNKCELQSLIGFGDKHLDSIWQEFTNFIQIQEFLDIETMLQTVSSHWHYFNKFCQSFNQLKAITDIKGLQFSEDSCTVIGECLNFPWKVTINFDSIEKNWDIFSSAQEYFQL